MKLIVQRGGKVQVIGQTQLMKVDLQIQLPASPLIYALPDSYERTITIRESTALAVMIMDKLAAMVMNRDIGG